jgi:hypothetical protein
VLRQSPLALFCCRHQWIEGLAASKSLSEEYQSLPLGLSRLASKLPDHPMAYERTPHH